MLKIREEADSMPLRAASQKISDFVVVVVALITSITCIVEAITGEQLAKINKYNRIKGKEKK